MGGLFTYDELQRYSKKFLCSLYRRSHGNLNNSESSNEIFFKNVRPEAYERPSLGFEARKANCPLSFAGRICFAGYALLC